MAMLEAFGRVAGEERITYCLCGRETRTVYYTLVPLLTGTHNITFTVRVCACTCSGDDVCVCVCVCVV